MALSLTAAFSANPRAQALKDGSVKPENIDLGFVTLPPGELFYRNLEYDEFDVSEMSISETLLAWERGDGTRWDWSALPVFLSKAFVWLDLYVHTNSGIETLGDLRGKRVGVPDYDMTAALWMRATMKELYGYRGIGRVVVQREAEGDEPRRCFGLGPGPATWRFPQLAQPGADAGHHA